MPVGFRANQLPDSQVGGGGFLDLFGRPVRETPCECERSSEVSLSQALNLVNGPTIADALIDPNGRISTLLKSNPDDAKIAEEMYLAALSRLPSPEELAKAKEYLATGAARPRGRRTSCGPSSTARPSCSTAETPRPNKPFPPRTEGGDHDDHDPRRRRQPV